MECKKVKFVNEASAEMYIKKLKGTSVRAKKPVRAYLCEKCLSWHLTSIEAKENMQLVYANREINNLKAKVLHLQNESTGLKKRSNNIELLEKYSTWLMEHGYLDTDWQCEPPYAIDEFLRTIN